MQVIWKGSLQTQDGAEKVTLGIPEGMDDELHLIKKAVKQGKKIALVVIEDEAVVHDTWKEKAMSMFDILVEQLREECKPKLLEERREEDGK